MPRWLRGLLWGAVFFVSWCVLGFFVAPPILRGQLEKRLSEQLHRHVTIGKVQLNPLTLSVVIESFSVAEPAAMGGQFIGWRRLFVNFDAFSVLFREWRFQAFELDGFSGQIAVAKNGQLNFGDLLTSLGGASSAAPKVDAKPWPVLVGRMAITNARLAYSDASRTEPFTTVFGPTSFSLRNFHTGGANQAPGEFAATTEAGETFAWKGELRVAPLRSSGRVELGKISLKKYTPFYSDRVKFDLKDGWLGMALDYEFEDKDGKPSLRIANGHAILESLQIAKRGASEPVIALNQVELVGLAATWPTISAEVARVAVTGGSVVVQRTAEGIDLVDLLMPVVAGAPPAVTLAPESATALAPAAEPLNIDVAEISIRELAVTVEDRSTPRLARHELTELTCDLRNFSLANPAVMMPFGFKAKLAPEGGIHAAGTISLAPLKADLALELNAVSLASLSPYAETFVNLRIGKGRLTTALNLRLELPVGSAPVIAAQGDVNVDEFAVYDAASVDEIARWSSLTVKGIEYSSAPAKLMISEVTWVEPTGHLIVNADGVTNFALALKPADAAAVRTPGVKLPNALAARPAVDEPIFITLDRFVVEKAAMGFIDRSLQPNVYVSLNEISGVIEGLASSELARATVSLSGKVDGVAPVSVTGKINPLSAQAFTDLKVTMKAIELVPVGPYAGKFAGYELARGSLNLDVKCRVAQRKIDCTNVVTIDQFTFGNATNSPDATKLPVRLAVALLKDTAGRIVIDVPVQGSLDDPNIRSGRVIWRVITNLLVKAATAPFSLLGSLFGGEKGQDLSFLQFAVGAADPQDEAEVKKLDVVAKALLGRPTLNLEIVGGYDEVADGPALRELALENKMRNIIWADRRMVETELTLEQVQIDPVQKAGMIRRLYYKTYPSEKPRHASFGGGEPSGPVAGSRGNLGAFKRSETTISKARAVAKYIPLPDKNADPSLPPENAPVELKSKATLTPEEMKARLLGELTLDDEAYRQLALERATAVRKYLVNTGQVPAERISLAGITEETPAAKGARVELRLK